MTFYLEDLLYIYFYPSLTVFYFLNPISFKITWVVAQNVVKLYVVDFVACFRLETLVDECEFLFRA